MSGLFGGGGQSKANIDYTNPTDVNVPPFLSSGGITPQQQDFGEYSYGQNMMGEANLFGESGTGQSTMATQGAGGAALTKAQTEGSMSDTDQEAQYQLYQNDLSGLEQGLQTQSTLSNLQQEATQQADQGAAQGLGSLAALASQGGGFGTSGGSFTSSST